MSTVSADPDNLQVYVDGHTQRAALGTHAGSTRSAQSNAAAGCGEYAPSVGAIASVSRWCDSVGASNESWVETIRTELLAADTMSADGVATANTDTVVNAVKAAGLEARPEVVEVPATTAIGVPRTSGFADDPVSLFNGNFVHSETDLEFPGLASSLAVVRTYNSLNRARIGAFGAGWTSALDVRVDVDGDVAHVLLGDGATAVCALPLPGEGARSLPGRADMSLVATETGFRLVELDDDVRWDFGADGRLAAGAMGATRLVFGHDDRGRVDLVTETTTGRSVRFRWSDDSASGVVVAAVASDGRRVEYRYDAVSQLVNVDAPGGGMRYAMSGGLMRSFIDADGVEMVVNTYDDDGRVLSQRSQFGRITQYTYESVDVAHLPGAVEHDRRRGVRTVVRGDDGVAVAMTHNANGELLEMVDGAGAAQRSRWENGRLVALWDREHNRTLYRYDPAGRVSSRIDPDGRSTDFQWDDQGRLTSRTDRAGNVTSFDYVDDLRSPVRITAPDGSVATLALDERGLVTATTDADGVRTEFGYDSDGQLIGLSGANGGLGHAEYDDTGWLIRTVDATGIEVALEVDPSGRAHAMTRAGVTSACEYTPAGRPVAGSEPGDVTWANQFDDAGSLVAVTDAEGSSVGFEHDTCGNVVGVVTPDGERIVQEYDAANRLIRLTQPGGATSTRSYDLNGESIAVTDPTGRTWRRELDALGRTARRIEPDGAATTYTYHPNGEVASTTLADGRRWRTQIDRLGRTTAVTRPDGTRSTIAYTPGGRVARRTSPAGRVEEPDYDAAGRCIAVSTDGQRHEFTLDEIGRVTEMVESDGRTTIEWGPHGATGFAGPDTAWSATYGDDGRLATVTDAAGIARNYSYDRRGLLGAVGGMADDPGDGAAGASIFARDVRGRVASEQHPGGRRVEYAYDSVGHLDHVTDGGVATTLVRDSTGQLTGLRHPDGSGWDRVLDDAGREVRRTDTDGRLLAESTYDVTGRLATIADDTGEIGLLWDDDDLLVARLGGSAPVRIERDADGWLVASTGADGVRSDYERDDRGRIAVVRRGGEIIALDQSDAVQRDLAGRIVADRSGRVMVYDPAGRISEVTDTDGTTAYRYDDGSGLLTEVDGPLGTSRFEYDPIGRLVRSERPDGTVTHDYDLAGRRIHDRHDDGRTTEYAWDRAGSLIAMVETDSRGVQRTVGIERDALGFVTRVAELDPLTSGSSDGSDRDVWGHLDDADLSTSLNLIDGGVWFENLAVYPHRSYDAVSRQWLSPDPLPTVPGTPGAGSAYTYNWLDPVDFVDPTGLRPLSDAEFEEWKDNNTQGFMARAVDAVPWDVVAAIGVVALGVALVIASGGTAAPFLAALSPGALALLGTTGTGILVGAGATAGIGLATGNFSYESVAWGGVLGGIGAGAGSLVGTAFQGANLATRTLAAGAASATVDTSADIIRTGHVDPTNTALSFGLGSAGNLVGEGFTAWRAARNPAPGVPSQQLALPAAPQVDTTWGPLHQYRHGPGPMTAIEHVNYRHGFDSGFEGVSRFADGTSAQQLRSYVDDAARYGTIANGGASIIHDVGRSVGMNASGDVATGVQVWIRDGYVRTAYPVVPL